MNAVLRAAGRAARLPSGRRGKWVMLVIWLGALVFLAPLAGKLTDVQDNQAKSWLPGNAESTKVLAITEQFRSSNLIPAILVYEKPTGLSPAELATIGAQAQRFGTLPNVAPGTAGPIASKETPPQAAEVIVPIDMGKAGWSDMKKVADRLRTTAGEGLSGVSVHVTGPAGGAADQADSFSGIDGALLLVGIGIAGAWALQPFAAD